MTINNIKEKFAENGEAVFTLPLFAGSNTGIRAYKNSFNEIDGTILFIAKEGLNKSLYVISQSADNEVLKSFEGEVISGKGSTSGTAIKKCPLIRNNSLAIQRYFKYTSPVKIGLVDSFGFGDRLGLANTGHLKALQGYNFKPILAQQSIRELTRTNRTAENVVDASVWAVFQEGYMNGFGADADHLKTKEDVDMMVKAGFRTFTVDPSDHIVNGVEKIDSAKLAKEVENLPWNIYGSNSAELIKRYENKEFKIDEDTLITSSSKEILSATLKYLKAIIHIKNIHDYLKATYPEYDCEVEVSIDETDTITTPFEHFFLVNELKNLNVEFISLAPRFIGDFEKGIEYKGDINLFKKEYLVHQAIAKSFGSYKLSFHSGSDKLAVYNAVAEINNWIIHIKTAGTSYLEALKVAAIKAPDLFRDILDYSKSLFNVERATYHVSADVHKIKEGKQYKDDELLGLMSVDDHRQVLHVAYGKVLTAMDAKYNYIFRNRLYECLIENEDLYNDLLIRHFHRHMDPFKK
jgi:hypothetical protein